MPVVDGEYDLASVDEDNLDQVKRVLPVVCSKNHEITKRTKNCLRIKKMRLYFHLQRIKSADTKLLTLTQLSSIELTQTHSDSLSLTLANF